MKTIPDRKACGEQRVGEAMRFLTDDWLADVATDYAGKCTLVALALTIIQRSLLDQRPVFFVGTGQRGSGKTTTIQMIIQAATGTGAAASPWSPNEEERRKALLSYLMSGCPYLLWDNVNRGTQISCPHIEKSCTSAYYADRKLGVSETVRTAAATVHIFTGNNVGPKGDLASRSLQLRLDVDRVDPENRDFQHPDPIGWTSTNRTEILGALYTILLGNPALDLPRGAAMKTRFKMWYRLVGSAVEHAAQCAASLNPDVDHLPEQPVVDFGAMFLEQEGEDEEATSVGEMLASLSEAMTSRDAGLGRVPGPFTAADVAAAINPSSGGLNYNSPETSALVVRGFLFPDHPSGVPVRPESVTKRLKKHEGHRVKHGSQTLVLKSIMDKHDKVLRFNVVAM
jgi:hypothetical protein